MKKLKMTLFAAPLALMATHAGALDGSEITERIAGQTVYLSTPYGLEMPLSYKADGTVSGDVSGFRLAAMFTPRETGRWWVDGDQMCQQWPTWYDGATHCFTLEEQGDGTLAWRRGDGMSGTARIGG